MFVTYRKTLVAAVVILAGACSLFAQEPATKMSREDVIAIQIGLDEAGFSCGQIDGKWGGMTRQALMAWQSAVAATAMADKQANAVKATGEFDPMTQANFPAGEGNYTNYVVTAADVAKLTPIPEDWKARSQLSNMWYETVLQMVAEKCHASEGLIKTLNPAITNWSGVAAGQSVTVLNLTPTRLGLAAKVQVSLSAKTVTAYDESGKIMALFPCSIAADKAKRVPGELTVAAVAVNPNYTYDPVNFPELDDVQHGYGKLIVPPGPKNPVGSAWIGLSRAGYGIHGTPHPDQIGKTFSHGCFRLANWNATRLAQMVQVGTPVEVVE
ncbi:MAG TPA: L,D-transpeptidase [Verrucomicrobiae bacterium]|nr:L,D-transpeptidase [Verrucomicrobiae bacterium]